MVKMQRNTWSQFQIGFVVIGWVIMTMKVVVSDPQTTLLNSGCSQYKVDSVSDFKSNLDSMLSQLRTQLNSSKHFATAQQARGSAPVFTLVQCRNYLPTADCVSCFEVAATQIRNCSSANGARVIYDGCFLRYESSPFYDQSTQDGHLAVCANRTASNVYQTTAQSLLSDLKTATPKINGFFAASKREVVGGNATVYGVAQCVETVSKIGCQDCLTVAYSDLDRCFPDAASETINVGCFLRYSDRPFFGANQTTDLNPFLKTGSSSKKSAIIAGVAGGVGVLILAAALFLWFKLRKPKGDPKGNILGATELRGPMSYSYKDLKSATKNFNEDHKLGEGGFGEVYKGVFKNGKVVAVKKLVLSQSQRAKAEFEKEVKIISNVHHRNLVRLLGCCAYGTELLLVYEYMANSSLDKFLFGEKRGFLNWNQRFDIILGTARGLTYLHEDFHLCIIHRDIKSSNILLDDDFQPKIADFGLARLLPENQSHLTTKFAGTLGYTAPEYAIYGQLSEKVDIYSFGVVVLEIISGQRSSEANYQDPDADYLLKKAWRLYESDMHIELVDESLNTEEYEVEEMKKIIEIALMCTQSSASMRPAMSEVVVLLKNKGALEHGAPGRPAFVESYVNIRQDTSISTATGSSTSNATASITQVSGR
ncbi:hypothetical protein Tsubulata_013888 [Turnera subulata]|uniref:Protein kinase domain-containing protein n=1 Tax=Turnera subulata TaxID=218843 RepID=A0A9Q0FA64_9ROSI|nr:hypothetical protein Tsubulata_013888 [Turnera subulata]